MEELAPYMRGWRSYFGFCETPGVLISLTGWVRRPTAMRLVAAMENRSPSPGGIACAEDPSSRSGQYGWQQPRSLVFGAHQGAQCRPFQGILQLARSSFVIRRLLAQLSRTAVYGPVCRVVWQGSAGDRRPYADLVANPDTAGNGVV
jgi:Group II intron, maturase-specific domain